MDTPVSDAPTASEMTSEQKETVQLCWEGGPLQGDDYLLEYYPDDFPKLPTCLDRRPKPYLMAKAA